MRILSAIFISILLAPMLGPSANGQSVQKISAFSRGCDQMMHKDFSAAISSFSEAISDDANDVNAYFRRGQSFFCVANYKEAVRDFERAAGKGAMDPNLYLWTGTAYAKLDNDERAVLNYEKAMRLNPSLAASQQQASPEKSEQNLNQSAGSMVSNRVESADQAVKAMARSSANLSMPIRKDARTVSLGTSQRAIDDYKVAQKNVCDNLTGSFCPGPTYSGIINQSGAMVPLGDLEQGVQATSASQPEKPALTSRQLESARENAASLRKTLREINLQISRQPQEPKLFFVRARLLQKLDKGDESLSDFTRAIDLDPSNPHYFLGRAFYYLQHKDAVAADADIRKAQDLNPIVPNELSFELVSKDRSGKL